MIKSGNPDPEQLWVCRTEMCTLFHPQVLNDSDNSDIWLKWNLLSLTCRQSSQSSVWLQANSLHKEENHCRKMISSVSLGVWAWIGDSGCMLISKLFCPLRSSWYDICACAVSGKDVFVSPVKGGTRRYWLIDTTDTHFYIIIDRCFLYFITCICAYLHEIQYAKVPKTGPVGSSDVMLCTFGFLTIGFLKTQNKT